MTSVKRFEWTRGRVYECGPASADKKVRVIRQIDRARDRINPFELSDAPLVSAFANLDGTEDQCLAFASKFGLLTLPARAGAAERLDGPDGWRAQIRKMKGIISIAEMVRTANSRRVRMKVTTVDVVLLSGEPGAKPTLVYEPRPILFDAMLLQFAQHKAGGGSIQSCTQCGLFFGVGGIRGRRTLSKFCTDSCKSLFHYHQQRKTGK